MQEVWEKLIDDVARNRCIVMNKVDAPMVKGIRVAQVGAVVGEKARIINNYSFGLRAPQGKNGGIIRHN